MWKSLSLKWRSLSYSCRRILWLVLPPALQLVFQGVWSIGTPGLLSCKPLRSSYCTLPRQIHFPSRKSSSKPSFDLIDHAALNINLCSFWERNSHIRSYLLTELSHSEEPLIWTAIQELPSISWNPKIQYGIHKSPSLVPGLSHINPVHTIPSYLSQIHFDIVDPPTSWFSQWLFSSDFLTNIL
jgi:hypothetical protein